VLRGVLSFINIIDSLNKLLFNLFKHKTAVTQSVCTHKGGL